MGTKSKILTGVTGALLLAAAAVFFFPGRKPVADVRQPRAPSAKTSRAHENRQLVDRALGSKPGKMEAVRKFGKDLSLDEMKDIFAFLRSNKERVPALKNEMLNALRAQKEPPPGLARLLMDIYRDREQDPVMRDYALQHMTLFYSKAALDDKARMQQVFWQGLGEKDGSIAGTALLSLNFLSQNTPAFDKEKFKHEALSLAKDENAGEMARITALQVCGRNGIYDALPLARKLAKKSPSVPLRISAIAALGDLGGPESRPFLKGLAEGPDERLKPAAQSALKRMKNRLSA